MYEIDLSSQIEWKIEKIRKQLNEWKKYGSVLPFDIFLYYTGTFDQQTNEWN